MRSQVDADVKFLRENGLMDYSMLIGIEIPKIQDVEGGYEFSSVSLNEDRGRRTTDINTASMVGIFKNFYDVKLNGSTK